MQIRSHMVGAERWAHLALGVAFVAWGAFGDFQSAWARGFALGFGVLFVIGGAVSH